jgi:sugar fermentation stimulation protein A
MHFPSPLTRGALVQRYKRFFADVALDDGTEITAHCPNPGAMLGLNTPGLRAWVSRSDDPKRKLAHTLELVEADGGLELAGYASHRREVRYGAASRIDFLLESPGRPPCWLEVKNCHLMREPGLAGFPDCVAARSLKHLNELSRMVAEGHRAVMLFVVQRTDCDRFAACAELDPAYARGLLEAAEAGVEVLVRGCTISPEAVALAQAIPWRDAPIRPQ